MEAADRGHRHPRLPPLSLGLTSVRLIVNQLEAEYARAVACKDVARYDPGIDDDDFYDTPLETSTGSVWSRLACNLFCALSRCIPSVTFGNFGVVAVGLGLFAPRMFSYLLVYPFCRLVFGTLYPAYASYKAVRTKNLKEYVKWMMYWIVFALFTCTETFTDMFLSWFPFYYEVKIVLVLWLLSPATKGSSILYRKFVHPALCRREQEIDEYIAKAKDQGYNTVLNLGTKGVNYATTVIMQTAIKGGGGIVQQIRKSYSLSDLTECEPRPDRADDEADDVLAEPQLIRRNTVRSGYNTRRSASESNSRTPIYFPEVDVDMRAGRTRVDEPDLSHIKSSEDISSGYSSADNSASLTRAASVGAGAGARVRARQTRAAVTAIKRPHAAEDSEVIIEELHDDDSFDYSNMPALLNVHSPLYLSHTDPPFIYQYVGDQVRIIQVLADQQMNFTQEKARLEEQNDSSIDESKTQCLHDDQSFVDTTVLETDQNNNDNNLDESKCMFEFAIENPITEIEKETVVSVQSNYIVAEHVEKSEIEVNKCIVEKPETKTSIVEETVSTYSKSLKPEETAEVKTKPIDSLEYEETEEIKTNLVNIIVNQENVESVSLESTNDNETPESDDEASFGTPEDSPKTKRKTMKGKYGKGKAPPPPVSSNVGDNNDAKDHDVVSITSKESLADILDTLPNVSFKETGAGLSRTVNPISEKKRRHKSKSPKRPSKSSSSGLGKLLQLPGKFAFWNKSDKTKGDNISTSSEDSRRSSTLEKADEFQSCAELNIITTEKYQDPVETVVATIGDDQISFKDASDGSSEVIAQDIMDKSDALQKLIEAKIESHPEYKYTTIDQEIPTTSKSTEV